MLNRRFGVSQNQRRGAGAFDAHLVFFRAVLTAFLSLNDEGREFVAIDFREHDEDVGKATIGNEHLFAVEDVVRAVVVYLIGRFSGHSVRTRPRFTIYLLCNTYSRSAHLPT